MFYTSDHTSGPFELRTLYPGVSAPTTAPLLWRNTTASEISAAHDSRENPSAIRLFELCDVQYGGRGLFAREDKLALFEGYTESQVNTILTKHCNFKKPIDRAINRLWAGGLLSNDQRVIHSRQPVLAPVHPNWIYGHFLLEVLPLALLLDHVCPSSWPIAVASCDGHWLPDIMRSVFGERPIIEYDPATEVLSAPCFIGCTQMISHTAVHPAMLDGIKTMKERMLRSPDKLPSLPNPERIFLSRSKVKEQSGRSIENAAEVEKMMAGLGYSILHPEKLSFAAQVQVFDRARIVVGEYSSAMHNTVFCRRGATVVCLNYINAYQSRIAQAFGHSIGYIPDADGRFHVADEISAKWVAGQQLDMRFDTDEIAARLSELTIN